MLLNFIKKYFKYILIICILIIGLSSFLLFKKLTIPKKVHYHAGFVVFQNDKKIDFSDFRYMRVKPCTNDKGHSDSAEEVQAEKAHLHDSVGDVVHIEAEGAKWKDLFQNINYKIDYSKVTAYVNGNKVINFENQKIKPEESIIILLGENKNNHLSDAVSKSYIDEKATKSVDCGN